MGAVTTVLLDLDGVIRHFDPSHVASVERAHGLASGALAAAANEQELARAVVTGRLSRQQWIESIGTAVGNLPAAIEWLSAPGWVDALMVDEVDRLRAAGLTVAVLTNGTDTLDDELAALGLERRFDAVFNSAEIGFAKPDRRAFEHACTRLDVAPSAVFYTDDSESKMRGAIEIGMTARRFDGVESFLLHLHELGITRR